MAVTEEQIQVLRTAFLGNAELSRRLHSELDDSAGQAGFAALIAAAFFEAADRHFTSESTDFEISRYVAEARARNEGLALDLDPVAAEKVIRDSVDPGPAIKLEPKVKRKTQALLLGTLVSDLELDKAGLDAFLAEARTLADQLLEQHGK